VFTIQLAGLATSVDYHGGLFTINPHTHIDAIVHTDLIIIPSLNHNFEWAIAANKPMARWIADRYAGGAEVASICTGAFLLAATGLLDGKTCATHCAVAPHFRQLFPKAQLLPDQLITDENGIYTNGGAYSFLNLIIYLVEKFYDREIALHCAKAFQIQMDRQSQSEFLIFSGQKQHGDTAIAQAQAYMEEHVLEKISVDRLCSSLALGRRNFDRRFIKATGNTPAVYVQRTKIEYAKKALETTRKTINEVMYEVGYADPKAFREVFRKLTGITPLEYRSKYNSAAGE
jgi:transcriptional regulator GlxA family with amidase domain